MSYRVEGQLSDGVVIINGAIWSRTKARKIRSCSLSGKRIGPGDLVYRPVGNAANRMHRALASVVESRLARAPAPHPEGQQNG